MGTRPTPAPAPELPAELVTAAAAALPGVSRAWLAGLLRDCGAYGLTLALLVVAWVKARQPGKPARYARVALAGWLNRLRTGSLTLEDVRAEVHGRSGPSASSRPFDPAACLAPWKATVGRSCPTVRTRRSSPRFPTEGRRPGDTCPRNSGTRSRPTSRS